MNNSPATPTGTGFSDRSSTYTAALLIGPPIEGSPPANGSYTPAVAHTVASVGPYAFTTRWCALQACARSDGSRSPADTNVTRPSNSPGVSTASSDGGNVA